MKKSTFVFAMLLMTFLATNNLLAQDDNLFFNSLKGNWIFEKVEIDKTNKANATTTAKVKAELEKQLSNELLFFNIPTKQYRFLRFGGKGSIGTASMEGNDLILTGEDGKVLLRGKLTYDNNIKTMQISYKTPEKVQLTLIFEK